MTSLRRFLILAGMLLFSAARAGASTSAAIDSLPRPEIDPLSGVYPVGAGLLHAHGVERHTVPVDVDSSLVFLLLYSGGQLELEVTSPSGRT